MKRTRAAVAALAAALVVDLTLIVLTEGGHGFSLKLWPFGLRVHDPGTPLAMCAVLIAAVIAVSWRSLRGRRVALIAAVGAAAIAAIAMARAARVVFPLADIAVLEIYTRHALAGHLLVGPYSQFGFHHPGPLYFYLLAPMYALSAERTAGMNAGAVVLAIASVATMAWIAARWAGSVVSAAVLCSVTIYVWRVKDLIASAWNPNVVILPTFALVVACAALACGHAAALPIVVFLASFILQTDVALVPVVVAICAVSVCAAAAAIRSMPADRVRASRASLNVSAWLLVALWFLPAAEQLSHHPGNLTVLWRFFVAGAGPGQPWPMAAAGWGSMMTGILQPDFSLRAGGVFVPVAAWPLVVAVLLVVTVAFVAMWAARMRHAYLAWLASLCVIASTIGLWSVTRVQGRLMGYEIFWMSALGALNLGVLAAAAAWYVSRAPFVRRWIPASTVPMVHGLLIATCVYVGFKQLEPARYGWLPVTASTAAAQRFGARLQDYMRQHDVHKPLVRLGQSEWGMAAGVLLELDRAGAAFAVEDSWLPMFPQNFQVTGDEDAEVTIAGPETHQRLAGRPDDAVVVASDPVYIDAIKIAKNRNR